jgi:DNA replication and repair protein RecF
MTEENLRDSLAEVPALKLEYLELQYFKNHQHSLFTPSENFNLITGANGSGKTSLLEAIHYLCVGRGFTVGQDAGYVMHGHEAEGFFLKGRFRWEDMPSHIECFYKPGEGKIIRFNEKPYERLSDHLGRLPVVAFFPGDIELVWGFAAERRRYLDQIFSFINPRYLEALKAYYKLLEQRNALLRSGRENRSQPDTMLLEVYDDEMLKSSEILSEFRRRGTQEINILLGQIYRLLAHNDEEPSLKWQPSVSSTEELRERWKKEFLREWRIGSTLYGPHRDDYRFSLNDRPLKKAASQGQQKTYIVALKLSITLLMTKTLRKKPILLLDDIFDKLDEARVHALLDYLRHSGSQIFVTDTSFNRFSTFDGGGLLRIFECRNGFVYSLL